MSRSISLVQQVRIATPCPVSWDDMVGDDRTRFCSHCKLNVFNFQAMTETEAEQLIIAKEGKLCARIYRRYDGTVLTKDCPVGLRAARKKAAWLAMRAAAALAFVGVSAAYAITGWPMRAEHAMENARIADAIRPGTYHLTRQTVERWIISVPPPPAQRVPVAGGCPPPSFRKIPKVGGSP